MAGIPPPDGLDRVIHEPGRLGIVASLAGRGAMTFNELRETLGLTEGNLSAHARVLEEAGYLKVEKSFVNRKPRTTMSLTARGRGAFRHYVEYLGRMVSPGRTKGGMG